jgi:hypothetical protein
MVGMGHCKLLILTACVVTAVIAMGCSSTAGKADWAPGRVVELTANNNHVLFAHGAPETGGMDSALVGGSLTLLGTCLGVRAEGGTFHVVVFPYGTEWASSSSVRLGEQTVAIGEVVDLTGGMSATQELADRVGSRCPGGSPEIFAASRLEVP